VNVEDWQNWTLTAGISPDLRRFIRFKPSMLFQFNPGAGTHTFPLGVATS
jgi:hypothetical protein